MTQRPVEISALQPEIVKQLVTLHSEFVLEKRLMTFHAVLKERTRYITIVLEDIFQSQNASAVIRSCECFGIQDIHIIENHHEFSVNPDVSLGSAEWINILKYNARENNSLHAIDQLKKSGYRIIGTSPQATLTGIEELSIEKGKLALFFGNETDGLSKEILANADEVMKIPTVGFTESLNLSVSVAICLNILTTKLRKSALPYQLEDQEKQEVLLQWLRNSVKSWSTIEKMFFVKSVHRKFK